MSNTPPFRKDQPGGGERDIRKLKPGNVFSIPDVELTNYLMDMQPNGTVDLLFVVDGVLAGRGLSAAPHEQSYRC